MWYTESSAQTIYVGETGRPLKKRLEEYIKAIRTANTTASVLAEHAWKDNHKVGI